MIYVFDVDSQQHNNDGLIWVDGKKLVNKYNAMTTFWPKQWKYIIIIILICYDTRNNIYADIQLY